MNARIAILLSEYNKEIIDGLLTGALTYFEEKNIHPTICRVAGAFELPLLAKLYAKSYQFDGIVCLGALIKGETAHFEYLSETVTQGIMDVSLMTECPISFGVLTTYTEAQAQERSLNNESNKGREAAHALYISLKRVHELKPQT